MEEVFHVGDYVVFNAHWADNAAKRLFMAPHLAYEFIGYRHVYEVLLVGAVILKVKRAGILAPSLTVEKHFVDWVESP